MSRVTALRTCSWAARGRPPSRRGSTRPSTRRRQRRLTGIRCSARGRRAGGRGRRDVRPRRRRRRRTRRTAWLALRGPRCGTGPPACGSRSSSPLSPQSAKRRQRRVRITSVSISTRSNNTPRAIHVYTAFLLLNVVSLALSRPSRRPCAASSHAGQAILMACRGIKRTISRGRSWTGYFIHMQMHDRRFRSVEGVWRLLTKYVPAGMIM